MKRTVSVISYNQQLAHQVDVPFIMDDKSIIALLESMYGFEVKKIDADIYDTLRGYDYLLTDKSIAVTPNDTKLDVMKKQIADYRTALQRIVGLPGNIYNKEEGLLIARDSKDIAYTALRKHGDN